MIRTLDERRIDIQKVAYNAILEEYESDRDASWKDCITDKKIGYVNAIIKEGVRFYIYTGALISSNPKDFSTCPLMAK
jgi:hypothetical protein